MIKYRQISPVSFNWRDSSHENLDSVLKFYTYNFVNFKIIEQSKKFLKIETVYGTEEIHEYLDDNFPYDHEDESAIPDWLKND